MATFKAVVLSDYKRNDGTYNVKIRVTHNRKTRYISTPFYVNQEQVTRTFKIKDALINEKLDEKIIEFRRKTDEIGFLADRMDIEHLLEIINRKQESIDFIKYMERYCDKIEKEGRNGTAFTYRVALNSIKRYNKFKSLPFSIITKQWMNGYWESLSNLKSNTKRSYILAIKAAYKHAQRELNNDDAGIIIARHGVFDMIVMPQIEGANDLAFENVSDMQAVIDVPYCGTWAFDFAKDMFIFSFVCLGINLADICSLTKDNYKDGVLTYRRKKVSRILGAGAEMKILVPEVGRIIIDKYSGDKKWLIDFGNHPRDQHIGRYIHNTFQKAGLEKEGNYLARAGHYKGVYVFYSARHSMATFARNVCGIDKLTVHEMLNHATPSDMKTTDVYLRRDYSHLWEANEKLMALFDWSFYTKQHHEPSKQYYNVIQKKD